MTQEFHLYNKHKETCAGMFAATLLINSEKLKTFKYPVIGEWTDIHIVKLFTD